MTKSMALIWYSCISLSIFADLLGPCICSEVVFPEAAADGGGGCSGGHGEDCWELRGRPPPWDVFLLYSFVV